MKTFRSLLCVAGVLLSTVSARAIVYATDIQINGSLFTASNASSSPFTITYRLNQTADLGVTVAILQGTNQVATIKGGTNMGLNSVVWGGTNNSGAAAGPGTYSLAITAAASGFTNWTQISVDTNAGNYAADPNGLAVNNNTNSPYYGRVVVGCSTEGGVNPISGAAILDGIYKYNADGSYADEGGFGYGGYTVDDLDESSSHPGEMPSASTVVPLRLRIGGDDRIYMLDYSSDGAVVAFDMLVSTNQVVIDDGGAEGGFLGGKDNYSHNPDLSDLRFGIKDFDVTTNAAVWLCNFDSPPNWGIWLYHLTNGASDPNDTIGTQAVTTGGDLSAGSSGGCMIDASLDIFVSQAQASTDSGPATMLFRNWQGGVLPPEAGGTAYADGKTAGQAAWAVGAGDPTMTGINDTVINSRTQPTYVALPMGPGNSFVAGGYGGNNSGIRVLNAVDGSVVSVTNGASIQTLTNIDLANVYTCAAWDNAGNLYAASYTTNLWRVWSPPGTNTNTTVAVAQVVLSGVASVPITITGFTAVPNGHGCSTVTLTFTASPNQAALDFSVEGSSTLNGTFSPVASAVITGSAGSFQAAFTSCSTEFYEVENIPSGASLPITITGITRQATSPGCATVTIAFTASSSLTASAFTVVGAPTLNGTYSAVGGAVITGSAGSYQATFSNCSTQFYLIEQ